MTISGDQKAALKKQVEFYFSDVNIVKDTFLKGKIAEDAKGFVPLSVLLTFNRVNSITTDVKELLDALKDSDKLTVDAEKMAIARSDPLPESSEVDSVSIYCKPIPAAATLEDLQTYFGKFGTVKAVWRRYFPGAKDNTKSVEARTKPSVFVVYSTLEEVEKLIKDPPQYDGIQLSVQSKLAYMEAKSAELALKARVKKPSATDSKKATPKRTTPDMPKDSSWSITDVGEIETFGAVKGLWPAEEQKGVRYVFTPSKEEAIVIFQDKDTSEKMIASIEKRAPTLNGKTPTLKQVTGEAEEKFLESVSKEIADRAESHNNDNGRGGRGGRGGGRGRGGRGRGGKRNRDD
eukprot:Tbor_TRINITY_DN5484_c3_g2::TRINITY_DN5484_c3_g2_i5::g.25030::m.25030/K11090/LA, SSB; lupus La protein